MSGGLVVCRTCGGDTCIRCGWRGVVYESDAPERDADLAREIRREYERERREDDFWREFDGNG
jgi:hypothetical protein